MEDKLITSEDISKLSNNIKVVYKFLHPNGLTLEELEKRANENTFYRIIYLYHDKTQEG